MNARTPNRARSLVVRVVRFTLILSGLAAWAAAVATYLLDASPLNGLELDMRLTWARAAAPGDFRGGSDSTLPHVNVRVPSGQR